MESLASYNHQESQALKVSNNPHQQQALHCVNPSTTGQTTIYFQQQQQQQHQVVPQQVVQVQQQQHQQDHPVEGVEFVSSNLDQQQRVSQQEPQHQHQPLLSQPRQQNSSSYQIKCSLLEYHIQEAILINKALKSELKQYRDKIDFEKKLRSFLINRVKGFQSNQS